MDIKITIKANVRDKAIIRSLKSKDFWQWFLTEKGMNVFYVYSQDLPPRGGGQVFEDQEFEYRADQKERTEARVESARPSAVNGQPLPRLPEGF